MVVNCCHYCVSVYKISCGYHKQHDLGNCIVICMKLMWMRFGFNIHANSQCTYCFHVQLLLP